MGQDRGEGISEELGLNPDQHPPGTSKQDVIHELLTQLAPLYNEGEYIETYKQLQQVSEGLQAGQDISTEEIEEWRNRVNTLLKDAREQGLLD